MNLDKTNMEKINRKQEIIKLLFKDFLNFYNSRSISKIIGISHAGAFKILKKLEARNIVNSRRIGKALIYSLDAENPVASKEIELALLIEAQSFKRWSEEFKELKDKSRFVILFGSTIRNEKIAKDVDLLIVADKENFKEISKVIEKRQSLSNKKIHAIIQNLDDFKKDIANKNKAIIEIIKTGIVLFGQEEFRKLILK